MADLSLILLMHWLPSLTLLGVALLGQVMSIFALQMKDCFPSSLKKKRHFYKDEVWHKELDF